MINETEIRVGNWFEHDGQAWSHRNENPILDKFNFQWNFSDWYGIGECTISLEVINPIPLTPEILEKAGFIKDEWSYTFPLNGGNSGYSIEEYGDLLGFAYGGELTKETFIRHVHQLQNLYFALTGEELEIKL